MGTWAGRGRKWAPGSCSASGPQGPESTPCARKSLAQPGVPWLPAPHCVRGGNSGGPLLRLWFGEKIVQPAQVREAFLRPAAGRSGPPTPPVSDWAPGCGAGGAAKGQVSWRVAAGRRPAANSYVPTGPGKVPSGSFILGAVNRTLQGGTPVKNHCKRWVNSVSRSLTVPK